MRNHLSSVAANEAFWQDRKRLMDEALARAPDIEHRNQAAWTAETADVRRLGISGWSEATISYAVAWARLMQARIAQGESVESCVAETAYLANGSLVKGSGYARALKMLIAGWIHGVELRRVSGGPGFRWTYQYL